MLTKLRSLQESRNGQGKFTQHGGQIREDFFIHKKVEE